MQRRLYQMQVRAVFSEKQPEYRYMPLQNNLADVFIYRFVEEVTDEDGNTLFVHDFNQFRINSSEITEKMIKKDPYKYLDYSPSDEKITLEDRINTLEDAIVEMAEVIYNG